MKLLVVILMASLCSGSQPTMEDYQTYELLEKALLGGSYNLYILAETFYPKIGSPPICQPVTYSLTCESDGQGYLSCSNSTAGYKATYLWTLYDVDQPIGPLLLSYANDGIAVRGFEWEDACLFLDEIKLNLTVSTPEPLRESLVFDELKEMTAVVRQCVQLLLTICMRCCNLCLE